MKLFENFRRSGGGVQEKSSAWNPFVSHTIAEVKNVPLVVREGEQRPLLPLDNATAARHAAALRAASYPMDNNHWHATLASSMVKKRNVDFVQTLSNKDAYRKIVESDTYFPRSAGNRLDRETLSGILRATQGSLARSSDVSGSLEGAEMVVLAQAAALATKFRLDGTANPIATADAARGLACLQNLNLLDSIRDPIGRIAKINEAPSVKCPPGVGIGGSSGHDNDRFDDKDFACAWRIAQILEATPLGFKTLKKVTQSDTPTNQVHESVQKHDEVMLRVYLKAAREKMKEAWADNLPLDPDPTSIHHHLFPDGDGTPPGESPLDVTKIDLDKRRGRPDATLLDKAMLAAREHLIQSNAHAQSGAAATPFQFDLGKAPVPVHEWAVAAVRNEVYTDKLTDEHGEPTKFAKMEEQLEEMDVWVNRASGRNDDGTLESKWDRVKRGFKEFIRPRHYRSPLNAYKRLAPGIKKTSGASFRNAEEGGVGDARAFRDGLILNLEAALKRHGGERSGQDDTHTHGPLFGVNQGDSIAKIQVDQEYPDLRVLRSAARLAILEQFGEETGLLSRYLHGDKLDDGALDKALERVSGFLDGGLEGQSELVQSLVRSSLHKENRPLTPERLTKWAAEVGGPNTIEEAVTLAGTEFPEGVPAPAPGDPDWRAFGKAMDRVINGTVDRVETKPLKGLPKDEIGAIFEELIQHKELGSSTTLVSGGSSGVGISGFVGTVVTALHWLTAKIAALIRPSMQADFKQDKNATITIGLSPEGTELFLGGQKVNGLGLGAGVAIGPGFSVTDKLGAGVGLSVSGGYSWDRERREGVTIRIPRTDTGVQGVVKEGFDIDPDNNEKLGHLMHKLINQCQDPDENPKPYINAPGEDDRKSLLKNIWQEWPEVSINYAGLTDKRRGPSFGIGLGGGFAYGELRGGFGPSLEKSTTHSKRKSVETGGALHVDTHSVATTKKVRFRISGAFTAVFNLFKNIGGGINGGDALIAQSVPGVEVASAGAVIHRKGTAEQFIWITQDGELKKESYRQIVHQNAKSFVDAVRPDMHIWAQTKAFKYAKAKFHDTPAGADGSPLSPEEAAQQLRERNAAVQTEYRKLSEHLQNVQDETDPMLNFLAVYELRDVPTKDANDLDSIAKMAWEAGDKTAAEQCKKVRKDLLRSEHSYEPGFLVDVSVGYERKPKGLNHLLIRQQVDMMVTTNLRTID